jgi:hypothetical protein
MTEETLPCPDCGADYTDIDNYCRQCGMYVAALRERPLVKTMPAAPPMRLERERAALPAPVKKAATALAIGTALQIGVNLAGKYLAGQAGRQAANALRPKPAERRVSRPAPTRALADPMQDAIAVSETVMVRRVWIRRSQG